MPAKRKLVAVVMADVVGYSRLMERDEAGTHQRLRALHDELIAPKIAEHGGRTVKTAGDGMLVEFPSATSALRCAVEVQRELGVRNLYAIPDVRIALRIGINLGDIIVDGDDIIGDDVNVAARLETLAEPGGICVASAIWEQVHEDLGIEFIDAGEQHVENISKPVRVFRVALAKGRSQSDGNGLTAKASGPATSWRQRFSARRVGIATFAAVAICAL
jgi:adenylate cyclase